MQSVILFSVWGKMNFIFFDWDLSVLCLYINVKLYEIIDYFHHRSLHDASFGFGHVKSIGHPSQQPQQQENKKAEIFLQRYRISTWSARTNSSSTELLFIRQTERTSEYSIIVVEHNAKKISQIPDHSLIFWWDIWHYFAFGDVVAGGATPFPWCRQPFFYPKKYDLVTVESTHSSIGNRDKNQNLSGKWLA